METNPQAIFAPAGGVASETWQIGIGRLPVWVFPPEGRPVRPLFAIYCNTDRKEVGVVMGHQAGESESALAERTLRSAVRDWRSKPARIETSAGLVPALADLLAGTGVAVELGRDLSLLYAAEEEILAKFQEPEVSPPGLLTGDVSVSQIEAFARATGDFLAAAPWRLLGSRDLLHVEAPADVDPELRWVTLARSGKDLLLTFFRDEDEWEAVMDQGDAPGDDGENGGGGTRWFLTMVPRWELSANDTDLWDRYGLPVFGDDELCPVPACLREGEVIRPDAHQLAFLEGLLRTLAASTEQDVDTGRWEKRVPTHLGPRRFVLFFPDLVDLLEDLARPDEGDSDPEDEIRYLLDEAQEVGGRQAVLLARRALAIQPDNAEAYVELGDAAAGPSQALDLYSRALDLLNRRLDAADFEEDDPADLGDLTPLRAHAGMATSLSTLGRREEAVSHLFEVYRLDPGDLMSYQDRLACLLVELGRDGEAQVLLDGNEGLDGPAYTLALIAFRREGDTPAARRALRAAWRNNAAIPNALLPNSLPEPPESSRLTKEHFEAMGYAEDAAAAWRGTPGALTWLAERGEEFRSAPGFGSGGAGKKAKGQKKKKKKKRR